MNTAKSKGMFLGTREATDRAYSREVKNILFEKLDMSDDCFDKDYFYQNKNTTLFTDIEYIFSTWGMVELDKDEVKRIFPSLKAVFYAAGTVKYFAVPFLENGVKIFSARGANAVPVAEVTVSQIILANKGYFRTLHNGKSNTWSEHDRGMPYQGNCNTNVGIIGAGTIGSLVAKMLKNYRLNVYVFDPFLSYAKAEKMNVAKVEKIEELFEKCTVISNHLADNPQTVNIINKSCFDKMGDNAVFINTGRGRQVNENDLINALTEKPDRVALLDVTYPEPPEKDSRLYTMDNVFLSPHLAGSSGNEIQRMGEYMLNEFLLFTGGKETHYEVTKKMLETMA